MSNVLFLIVFVVLAIMCGFFTRKIIELKFPEINQEDKEDHENSNSKMLLYQLCIFIDKLLPVKRSSAITYREKLSSAGVQISPEAWHGFKILCVLVLPLFVTIIFIFNPQLSVAFKIAILALSIIGAVFLPKIIIHNKIEKRKADIEAELPYILELLSTTLKAGYSLPRSIKIVGKTCSGPLAEEFTQVDREVTFLGISLEKALENLSNRCRVQSVRAFTTALAQAKKQGSSLSKVLETQAKTAREKSYTKIMIRINKITNKMIPIIALLFIPIIIMIAVAPSIINSIDSFMNLLQ